MARENAAALWLSGRSQNDEQVVLAESEVEVFQRAAETGE
jgi:hypothetical protein